MRKTILSLCLLTVYSVSVAQKMLTVSDAVLKQRTTLAPEKLSQLTWMGTSSSYAYIDIKDNSPVLYTADAKTNLAKPLITLTELNTLFKTKNLKEVKDFPALKWNSATICVIEKENKLVTLDLAAKSISSVA